jgi:hypothetical protein
MAGDVLDGFVVTALGRVNFQVSRDSSGTLVIPQGTILKLADGTTLMGTLSHDIPLRGFTRISASTVLLDNLQLNPVPAVRLIEESKAGPKSALDRLLEDEDLV